MSNNLLAGKRGVILGVANKRSIAWGIAESTYGAGAKIAFSYQNERLQGKVEGLTKDLEGCLVAECDVSRDESIDAFFAQVKAEWGTIDFLVHAVAFAQREDLEGSFEATSREGFRIAHDVSAYSLVAVARAGAALMPEAGGSIVTLSYYGAEKVIPKYNVMGVAKASLEASVRYLAADLGPERNIRVNAISAGPINTLAARGISGFTDMLGFARERAPLRRNTEPAEVGDTALFLVSDLARGITGETIYVDNGYNIVGM